MSSSSTHVPARTAEKLVLFGDSITQLCHDPTENGFVFGSKLASDYQRKLDIVTRGYGGYTSRSAKYMIGPILEASISKYETVSLLVIFFGTNDASLIEPQTIPIEEYSANMKEIVETALQKNKNIKVILVGPGLKDESDPTHVGRTTESHKKFCDAAGELAKQLDVGYVPLWYLQAESVGWKKSPESGSTSTSKLPGQVDSGYKVGHLFTDGLHFTGEGYQIWYKGLKQVIEEKYPELLPQNLLQQWPCWSMLDIENPAKSLAEAMNAPSV